MKQLLQTINTFLYDEFIFSSRYRLWRHIVYWTFHIHVWAAFWVIMGSPASFERNLFNMALWVPVFILFGYPLVYGAIPHLLLKGKVWQFVLLIMLWGVAGLFINAGFHNYLYVPLQQAIGFEYIPSKGFQAHSYLCMTTSAASPMIIKFFKLWTLKQREWLNAQQAKVTAELQLLKAQVHPHFLFNTLNNIYSFSLERSPKTPEMILKLSSLLSYILYDCRSKEVRLEKEIEIMKNYIDLEKERYGTSLNISWNVDGDINERFIAPLMMLPFLENAFKHGSSEQIEQSCISVSITSRQQQLGFKIVNSKNEYALYNPHGIGINNVKKRLDLLYPDRYQLLMTDEGKYFVVVMQLTLAADTHHYFSAKKTSSLTNNIRYETSMPSYRR